MYLYCTMLDHIDMGGWYCDLYIIYIKFDTDTDKAQNLK